MGRQNADFDGRIFGVGIDVDLKDPKHYAVYLGQSRARSARPRLLSEARFRGAKNEVSELRRAIASPAQLAGRGQARTRRCRFRNEDRRGELDKDAAARSDRDLQSDVDRRAGNARAEFCLATIPVAKPGSAKSNASIVAEKSAFPKIAAIFAKAPVETLQAWQAFNVADHAAPYLSKAFADALFEMRNKTLSGQAEQQVRWKRGVQAVSGGDYGAGDRYDRFGNLGWAVGQLYSAKYFPPAAKAKIEELVAQPEGRDARADRGPRLDGRGDQSRGAEEARHLQHQGRLSGSSRAIIRRSKSATTISSATCSARRAPIGHSTSNRLADPVDRTDWGMTPQTNDAYNGSLRDIVFPAGILQPPMFDPNADPAINYGAIGGVIGHELTHGFDDQGRKFDADGKLHDWWTAEDAKTFEARAAVLGAQYSKFEPLPGAKVNGELTMGENIADLGGLTIALDAYRASLKGKPAPVIDGLTGEQRVFLGWAQAWRGKVRDDFVRKQVVSDPHSPRQYRVNGVVRNIDAWYDAFEVKSDEKLFVDPKDRVRIW